MIDGKPVSGRRIVKVHRIKSLDGYVADFACIKLCPEVDHLVSVCRNPRAITTFGSSAGSSIGLELWARFPWRSNHTPFPLSVR